MLVGVSIRNFKAIQALERLPLSDFHVLVGPNGVGKSTFLDAVDFVRDCLQQGPEGAVSSRGISNFNDMTWMRQGGKVEIDLWLDIADQVPHLSESLLEYNLAIHQDPQLGVCVAEESLLRHSKIAGERFATDSENLPKSVLHRSPNGIVLYLSEETNTGHVFNFEMSRLALSLTPPDDKKYPTANAVKRFLMKGIRYIQLDSPAMRQPCPATRGTDLELDGSNLARVVGKLLGVKNGNQTFPKWAEPSSPISEWVEHLQFALPDLVNIGWDRRQADNAEFILLKYQNGLEAPSWVLSDGTLRMLALTIPAFLPAEPAIYMVEEPENGVHPKALEIILRSLSSIPGGQMLLATHSPLVVQQCGIKSLLCFSKNEEGTQIVLGPDHPVLKSWDGSPDLDVVFASGLLE